MRIPGWVKGRPVLSDQYEYSDGKRTGYPITVTANAVRLHVKQPEKFSCGLFEWTVK
ncbi:hypothetical protein [Segatella buccae]|uniref:hypothetical protein n=1 Tax=Segatella buccae TaxID=28126 RepID=UPI0022E2C54C|nr:hypothetical protein [Segatella buccae]